MVNKDFCLSSYIAFRYIWKDGVVLLKASSTRISVL